MKTGIDSIAFSTSKYSLNLDVLAKKRNVAREKYYLGIGQTKMSIFPPNEDIVTVAIDAARKVLAQIEDKNDVDMLIFATESSFDLSKSAGIYVHKFLKLRDDCRVFDVKQACYSAAAALQLARFYVKDNPNSKVLVIGSDIIRYLPETSGEPTQGGAAVAFIVSKNPRILEVEPCFGVHTVDVADFWRPVCLKEALFDGKLSAYNYLRSLDICTKRYFEKSGFSSDDIDHVCFHAPFGKMARKANNQSFNSKTIEETLVYNSLIGNSCSASLFISFISLADNFGGDLTGSRIGFFSYGSGSVAEFFCGVISENYKKMLTADDNKIMLEEREDISFEEYESLYKEEFCDFRAYKNIGSVTLSGVDNNKRVYGNIEKCENSFAGF
ncbi:MAG: hydroxymethylglutaryl-CoA synthase [Holosporaceae bacterium]|jgi:hydroxymethylglutaryl-CoA synthase|nr:hydroxymethylglutaryl-CoA synthase [Holosporaceae bacterium]